MMSTEEADSPMCLLALAAARAGWRVFPVHTPDGQGGCSCRSNGCENQGKHPRIGGWKLDATNDISRIRSWWRHFPDANIGVATGEGVLVVDLDPEKGGWSTVADLRDQGRELSKTLICQTGSGGYHFFYRLPPGVKLGNTVERLGKGIDTRCEGGLVVGAGSLHKSGNRYEFGEGQSWETELAPCPQWILDALTKPETHADTGKTSGLSYLKGERNDRMFKFAAWMRDQNFSVEEIKAALHARNRERCKPPLSESEVEQIARSSEKYAPTKDGGNTSGDPWNRSGAEDIFGSELAPTEWLCEALQLGPGRPFGVWGAPGGGKTLFVMALGLAVASGKELFGAFPVKRGKVLHISYDSGTRAVRKRYRQLAEGMGIDWRELVGWIETAVFPEIYLNDPHATEKWEALCKGFALIIVDNFRDSVPGTEENSSELAVHLKTTARISDKFGCCFVYLHHTKKMGESVTVDSGRGSGAIPAASGAVWAVIGTGNAPRLIKPLRTADDSDGWPEAFSLVLTDWRFEVCVAQPELEKPKESYQGVTGDVRMTVLKYFETHGEWQGSIPALAKSLAKRKDAVAAVIGELKTEGKLSQEGTYHAPRLVYMQSGPHLAPSGPGPDGDRVSNPVPNLVPTHPPVGGVGDQIGPDGTTRGNRTRRPKRSGPGPDRGNQ